MTTKTDMIVIKIIETDKIVINKGLSDKISSYMEFLVYVEGEEIIDPLSHESLGTLENPKGIFKPIHIQEKMTTLISKTKRPNKIALTLATFGDMDAEYDLLKTIKIGDKVKIINEI